MGTSAAGVAAARRGEFHAAERLFGDALNDGSGASQRILVRRAYVRVRLGDVDGALADLGDAARDQALDSDALWVMACLRLRAGAWGSAESALRELVDDPSRSALAHGMLAFALEMQEKSGEALCHYEAAMEGGQVGDSVLYHHGLVAYRLGRYDESVASWAILQQRYPGRPELVDMMEYARYAAGCDFIERGDLETAIQRLESCEKLLADVALNDAIAELRLYAAAKLSSGRDPGEWEWAWRHVIAASARRPDDPRVLYRLALREYAVGAYRRAAHLCTRALRGRPDDPRIRHALAVCRIQLGEQEAAARELTALHERDGGERTVLALAALHIRAGRWEAARALLAPCSHDPRARALLPECEYRSGQETDAETGPWLAAYLCREGRVELARQVAQRPGAAPLDRSRRELALLLRRAALAEADAPGTEAGDWSGVADLIEQSQELAAEPTGCARFYAIVLALDGRFPAAVRMLDAACERDPVDHRQAHTLALILLNALRGETSFQQEVTWERCIAAWGVVLHDEAFWARHRTVAEGRYGEPVPPTLLASLPSRLQRHLEGLLPTEEPDDRQGITVLALLQREAEAAQALADAGGLPAPTGDGQGRSLICGPLRLVELGKMELFGAFLDDVANARPRLSRLFSQMGFAQTRLAAGTFREALDMALDLRCPSCRDSRPDPERRPRLCARGCSTFGAANPAYAALPDGHGRLSHDAHVLVMDIWLLLGCRALTVATPDLRRAEECLRAAVVRSMEVSRYWDTQQAIVTTALGRAEGLRRNDRLDEAVALLDTVHAMTGVNHRESLEGFLSAVLTDRAVAKVNESTERLDSPADDLRRAVRLNPYLLRAQVSLAAVLRMLAHRRRFAGSAQGSRRSLREAELGLAAALALWPGERALEDLREGVQNDLAYLAELLGSADDGR